MGDHRIYFGLRLQGAEQGSEVVDLFGAPGEYVWLFVIVNWGPFRGCPDNERPTMSVRTYMYTERRRAQEREREIERESERERKRERERESVR